MRVLGPPRKATPGRPPRTRSAPPAAVRPSAGTVRVRRPLPGPQPAAPSARGVMGTRTPRPKPASYVVVLSVVVVLNLVGLVMVLSASSVVALRQYGSSWYFFERQVIWATLGFGALFVTSRIDYHFWSRLKAPMILACFAMLVAVLVPGVGVVVGGSSRWVGAGWLRLQPSELMKFAMVVYGADLLSRRQDRIGEWSKTLKPMMIVFFLAGLLIMRQPDMGTTLVLACITFGILFASGTPGRPMFTLMGGALGAALVLGLAEPYRRARLLSFTNPWAHRADAGYQVVQSLVGLGSGHIFGVGLGASRAKWGFLPNAYTDFIFAIIGEELGLIGGLLVIGLFVGLAVIGMRVAARAPDRLGGLMVAGITAWITGQAIINLGAVIGLLPVTGVPLPFVSFGGSSLMIMMAGVGVVLNVASHERRSKSISGRRLRELDQELNNLAGPSRRRPPAVGR